MPRRYRRTGVFSRRLKTIKYSNETSAFASDTFDLTSGTYDQWDMIPAINSQGTRKAKNFTLTLSSTTCKTSGNEKLKVPIAWVLVYVPQGNQPNQPTIGVSGSVSSFYEPNQNVIMAGTYIVGDQPIIAKSRLARNLNSGDKLVFITAVPPGTGVASETCGLYCSLNYAISY